MMVMMMVIVAAAAAVVVHVIRVAVGTLVVDEDERQQHNAGADPVHGAGVLCLQHHLADKRQWDGQAEPDRHHKRRCQQHGKGPGDVGEQRCD
jgi:hypothetical protein